MIVPRRIVSTMESPGVINFSRSRIASGVAGVFPSTAVTRSKSSIPAMYPGPFSITATTSAQLETSEPRCFVSAFPVVSKRTPIITGGCSFG